MLMCVIPMTRNNEGHVLDVSHNTQVLNSVWETNTATNFGYAKWEEEPKFRTIMSYKSWKQDSGAFYNCLGCRYQLPAFSSPALYHIRNGDIATAAGHSDLVDHICLVPDSADFDTSCPNTLDFANPGPAHVPPADDAMFELQCRDPANASHTGVTLTKTVAWGTLTAMGYPYVNMCYRAAIMILFRSISPSF